MPSYQSARPRFESQQLMYSQHCTAVHPPYLGWSINEYVKDCGNPDVILCPMLRASYLPQVLGPKRHQVSNKALHSYRVCPQLQ